MSLQAVLKKSRMIVPFALNQGIKPLLCSVVATLIIAKIVATSLSDQKNHHVLLAELQ